MKRCNILVRKSRTKDLPKGLLAKLDEGFTLRLINWIWDFPPSEHNMENGLSGVINTCWRDLPAHFTPDNIATRITGPSRIRRFKVYKFDAFTYIMWLCCTILQFIADLFLFHLGTRNCEDIKFSCWCECPPSCHLITVCILKFKMNAVTFLSWTKQPWQHQIFMRSVPVSSQQDFCSNKKIF